MKMSFLARFLIRGRNSLGVEHVGLTNHFSKRCLSSQKIDEQLGTSNHFKFARAKRSLVQIEGSESFDFLQGLITNDVRHLMPQGSTGPSQHCVYSFMLNTSGKILADCFVYSLPGVQDVLFLDVDTELSPKIVALLKRYKIRRKVNIQLNTDYDIVTVFPANGKAANLSNEHLEHLSNDVILVPDPRNANFGFRFLYRKLHTSSNESSPSLPSSEFVSKLFSSECSSSRTLFSSVASEEYELFRYSHGIGEGSRDFVPEAVFPFEANAELLNAVSFHKGCYVGQELTARTYHTGVIRKRMLPVRLAMAYDQGLEMYPVQNVLAHDSNKVMGRFRVNHGSIGLAVLKFAEIFTPQSPDVSVPLVLANAQVQLQAHRPFWWPDSLQTATK